MRPYKCNTVGLLNLAFVAFHAKAQIASKCASILPESESVVCINKWAAVMPEPFSRFQATGFGDLSKDSFRLTSVPSDPSFELVRNATFIVFDETRGLDILGTTPKYEFVLDDIPSTHEAPVYVPELNVFVCSILNQNITEQRLLNLTESPPHIRNLTTNPPIYGVNGGRYFNGSIYWAVAGGNPFPNPRNESDIIQQSPGLVRVDPKTFEAEFILNNYFGSNFNSPNDLVISHKTGDIFFTDPWFGYGLNFSTNAPVSGAMTYRFRPSTGQVFVVDDAIIQPNGIGLSPDESVLYVADTGQADFSKAPADGSLPRWSLNLRQGRNVYTFDTRLTPVGYDLINRRPLYLPEENAEDGLHVTALQDPSDSMSYYIIGASGNGVDVISPYGELLVRITVKDFPVNNMQFAGRNEDGSNDLWLFGEGGIARLKLNLTGMIDE